jgi:hypothetical protein
MTVETAHEASGGAQVTAEQFDNQLRMLVRAEPYQPFFIVFHDGRTIFVDEPAVAFDNGSAGFIDKDLVHFFKCEEVREFRMVTTEMAQ